MLPPREKEGYNHCMGFLDWWFPRICKLCNQTFDGDIDVCRHCLAALPYNRWPCQRCGLPLPQPAIDHCQRCQTKPPVFTRTIAPLLFQDMVRDWVHATKFGNGCREAQLLGRLLTTSVRQARDVLPDVLVPVPLTLRRLWRRGHNQALLIAQPIAKTLAIPLCRTGVRRIGRQKPQRGQTRQARDRSVRGAFRATREWHGHVALIDDVMTTGATVSELARVLLSAGASRVDVWVAARVDTRVPESRL